VEPGEGGVEGNDEAALLMNTTDQNPGFEPALSKAERQVQAEAALHELRAYAGRVSEQLARLGHLRAGFQCQLAIHELDVAIEFIAAIAASAECGVRSASIQPPALISDGEMKSAAGSPQDAGSGVAPIPCAKASVNPGKAVSKVAVQPLSLSPLDAGLAQQLVARGVLSEAEHNAFPKGRWAT